MSTVVFDLDDVLVDMREQMEIALELAISPDIQHNQDIYDLAIAYGITQDEVFQIMLDHEVMAKSPPVPYSRECLQAVHEMGHTPLIATARGWHPQAEAVTRQLLDLHKFPVSEVCITPLESSKAPYIAQFEDVIAMIDDNPRHVIEAKNAGIPNVHMMTRPWNHGLNIDVKRVNCLREFERSLMNI